MRSVALCGLVFGACAANPVRPVVAIPAAPVVPVVVTPTVVASPTAVEILRVMDETYAAAKSYEDTGEVTLVFSGDTPFIDVKSFTTAFVRASHGFRFEF